MSSDNPFEVSSDSYNDKSGVDRDASSAEVSRRTVDMLKQTEPWVRLIGVLMWIGVVLMAIGTAAGIVFGITADAGLVAIIPGLLYGFVTVIYWMLAKSLTGYAKKISTLAKSESVVDLEDALEAQKTFWKIAGIMTLVTLVIYLVVLVAVFADVGIPVGFGGGFGG